MAVFNIKFQKKKHVRTALKKNRQITVLQKGRSSIEIELRPFYYFYREISKNFTIVVVFNKKLMYHKHKVEQ